MISPEITMYNINGFRLPKYFMIRAKKIIYCLDWMHLYAFLLESNCEIRENSNLYLAFLPICHSHLISCNVLHYSQNSIFLWPHHVKWESFWSVNLPSSFVMGFTWFISLFMEYLTAWRCSIIIYVTGWRPS